MNSRSVIAGAFAVGVAAIAAVATVVLMRQGEEPGPPQIAGAAGAAAGARPQPVAGNAEAQSLMAEAEALLNRGDDEAALQQYARALSLYERSDDLVGQGSVSLGLAQAAHVTGQSDRARAHYDAAVELFRRAGNGLEEARALVARADLEKDTFNWADSARYYREARAVWATVPEPKSDRHVVFLMDQVPEMPQGETAAREVLKQADLIFGNLGDRELLGDVAALRADLDWNLGMRGVARGNYSNAQVLYHQADVPLKEGATALKGAALDILQGQNVQARGSLDAALDAFDRAGDETGLALAWVAEGDLERLQGRIERARAMYDSAVAPLRDAGHAATAAALLKLGQVDIFLGATEAALSELEEARDLYRASGSVHGEAAAALALAMVIEKGSDPSSGQEPFDVAAERFAEAGNPIGAGRARLGAAGLALARGDTDAARALFHEGAARFDEADVALGLTLVSLGLGDTARAAGDVDAATEAYRAAVTSFAALATPVADANRLLELPPVETLFVLMEVPEEADIDVVDLEYGPVEIAQELQEQLTNDNLAAFPGHNAEARALVAEVENRVDAARAYLLAPN